MALSLFSKAKLIVQSTSHGLLDRVIDVNSVEAHEQLIRDLEAAMQAESTATIKAQVNAKGLHDQTAAIQQQIDDFTAGAKAILTDDDPSNDGDAEPLMAHAIELEEERDAIVASETAANENAKMLADTMTKLRAKHTQMMKELKALRTATAQAKTDNEALATMRKVNSLTSGVDSAHMGSALKNAQEASAVAREELKQAVGEVKDTPEALLAKSKAAARIAAMRASLIK